MLSFFKPTLQSRSWTFLSSLQVPHPHFSPSLPYPQPWKQQTLYISLHLSRNLYKWNHMVCILGLASFTQWNDFWDSCMLLPIKIFLLLLFLSLNSWHHWLNGPEFEQVPGDSEGQGHLVCCSPRACRESDTTEWLNNNHYWIVLHCMAMPHLVSPWNCDFNRNFLFSW